MANVFDQVQAPAPQGPSGFPPLHGAGWAHPDRVWGYAGFWWRVLAWAIDSVILSTVTMLVERSVGTSPFHAMEDGPSAAGNLFNISYIPGGSFPVDAVTASHHWHFPQLGWPELFGLLLPIAYYALLESSHWQATVGKRVCRLRVTRLDGRRISLARALGRYFGKFVSAFILGIGFLMIAWTRRKQGLHDLMADTLVVRLRPPSDLVRFTPPD